MSGRIVIAGATGYLGRHLVHAFKAKGWRVNALVRDAGRARKAGLAPQDYFVAGLGHPESLVPILHGADAVISTVGLTRQKTRATYDQVDYALNLNLLKATVTAHVPRFAYVHVLNAENMPRSSLARAKCRFVQALEQAPLKPLVIAPSAYFSDMEDLLRMARKGAVMQIGDGARRMNPIHGADLAQAILAALPTETKRINVGGPETLTQEEAALAAFDALGRAPRIIRIPRGLASAAVAGLKIFATQRAWGPAEFFLEASALDMVGDARGTRKLSAHFKALAEGKAG